MTPPPRRPPWLRVDRFLGEKGISKDSEAGREQLAKLPKGRGQLALKAVKIPAQRVADVRSVVLTLLPGD